MPPASNLARRIVDYDRDFAHDVVVMVVTQLGGSAEDSDPAKLHGFLSRAGSAQDERAKTTVEWKAGFAHEERLRALGLELAELLRAG